MIFKRPWALWTADGGDGDPKQKRKQRAHRPSWVMSEELMYGNEGSIDRQSDRHGVETGWVI